MEQEKPQKQDSISPIKLFLLDSRKIILLSLAIAVVTFLFSFCFNRVEQSYAFISCAILWGFSLVALATLENKKNSDS